MSQAHDELNALYQELRDELNRLARNDAADDPLEPFDAARLDQVDRRLMVRSAFAAIDALAYRLKQIALDPKVVTNLTPAECALCAEDSYDLTSDGQPQIRPARLRFLPNFRFAFLIAAKGGRVHFSLDLSGSGWQALHKGVRVRDRLMHPKSLRDLVVDDEEVRVSVSAFLWVESQLTEWLAASVRALEGEHERLTREVEALRSRAGETVVNRTVVGAITSQPRLKRDR